MSEPGKAVFLSYASQDAEAARRICEALRAAGIEVWFDQSELVGGDQWDGKIRGQIGSCALFVPIISANTQTRLEGYFRREWKQAASRTHDMADEKTFLLPVVIDGTRDAEAKVPAEFKAVQWTKLPGGETPVAFCARVKRLLGGSEMEAGRPRPAERGEGTAPPKKQGKRWLAPVIAGGVIALLALIFARPWEKAPTPTVPAKSVETAKPAAASQSEAQKLVTQARKIYEDGDELNRDNLFLAEELVQRALTLDPAEPAAWELATLLSCQMIWHAIEDTQARREALLRQANRAVALAPDSVAAQLVFANAELVGRFGSAISSQGRSGETEASLQRLAQREPQNWKIQRTLGTFYRLTGRMDEAIRTLQQAIELSGGHPMATADLVNVFIRRGRYAEAETLLTGALGRQRSGRLLTFNLIVKCRWRGDVQGAAKDIADWPDWLLQQDRGIAVAWQTALWARQPDLALHLVQQFPRQYVRDMTFSGPRAVLSARAQELAGNSVAAQSDWRAVLQLCDQDLAANAADITALYWKGWALARLGDQAGAQSAATLLQQRLQAVPGNYIRSYTAAALWATVGWTDVAVATLQAELEKPTDYISLSRAGLELEPAFDPLRQDPRFVAMMERAPAPVLGPQASAPTPSSSPPADSKSVAVLAFANLSDDKGNEYFSDGISEELLNVLAKIPGLKVTARTSSFHFKGMNTAIPEIAAQLGVAYVLEGSVRKQGDKVRITAQLIKAADGFHVWSDTFTRDLKDIFAVQDEIAGLIAQQLQLKLGDKLEVKRAVNPEAYRLVLEGRQFWNMRTEEGFAKAEAAFTKAIQVDPQFAEAHAGLGGVCVIRSIYRELDAVALDADDLRRAVSEGRRALEIDPSSADAHAVLGYAQMMGNQLVDSDRHFQQALTLNPNSALVHCWYALLLSAQGRSDTSLRHYQKAAELDPLWFINLQMLGGSLAFAQRFDQSLGIIERAAALRTDVFIPNMAERAEVLLALGRKEEAFAAARHVLKHPDASPRWHSDALAIRVLWKGGRRQEAEEEAARLFARWPQDSYLRGFTLVALGRFDEALGFLEHTPSTMVRNIYWDTMWDPWREDPRFQQLMVKFGRADEYKVARETLARMLKEQAAGK